MMETNTEHKSLNSMTYRQMRLYVDELTPEQEKKYNKELNLNPIKPKIYEATEEDIETIVNLYNKSWLTSNTPFRRLTFENIKHLYYNPNISILIAKFYGIPAGFIILDFEGAKDHYASVLALAVLPRFQHKGLGRFLGFKAGELFKQRNIKEIRSEVYVDNYISYKFNQAMGFKEIAVKTYINEKR
ncbi:MAG: GNAT family N-acetyltransferase [Promethearchaeota archaeon]|nr:MAG: GNAT family N-acetyltransferase [Candidatus Lokiarchaeota archaeon]